MFIPRLLTAAALAFALPGLAAAQDKPPSKADLIEFARTCLSVHTGEFDPQRMVKRGFTIKRETKKKVVYSRPDVPGRPMAGQTGLTIEKPGQRHLDCEMDSISGGLTVDDALSPLFDELKKAGYRRGKVRLRKNKVLDVWVNGPVKLKVYAVGQGYGPTATVVSVKFVQSHLPLVQ